MSNDIEAKQFDIGTTSIRLVRVGNVIQILFSSALEKIPIEHGVSQGALWNNVRNMVAIRKL